jgi:DNA-binding transcriptional LysR family regulator
MAHVEQLAGVAAFVEAARTGSFTAAAQNLGITKSAVGKSVARLEERLGAKLFYRTTRHLSLTPDGSAYFASCAHALDEIGDAERALTSKHGKPTGKLRIDMPAAFGRRVLLPVLLDIAKAHPALRLVMTFTDRIIDPVEEGIDLSVRFGELRDCSSLVSRRLTEQSLLLCASPRYLQAHGAPLHPNDLQSHDCIVGYRRGTIWFFVDERGETMRVTPPATHEIGDGDAIVAATIAGCGLSQMPASLVRKQIAKGAIVPLLTGYSKAKVEIHVIWPRTRHLVPKVRAVVDELVAKADAGALD